MYINRRDRFTTVSDVSAVYLTCVLVNLGNTVFLREFSSCSSLNHNLCSCLVSIISSVNFKPNGVGKQISQQKHFKTFSKLTSFYSLRYWNTQDWYTFLVVKLAKSYASQIRIEKNWRSMHCLPRQVSTYSFTIIVWYSSCIWSGNVLYEKELW